MIRESDPRRPSLHSNDYLATAVFKKAKYDQLFLDMLATKMAKKMAAEPMSNHINRTSPLPPTPIPPAIKDPEEHTTMKSSRHPSVRRADEIPEGESRTVIQLRSDLMHIESKISSTSNKLNQKFKALSQNINSFRSEFDALVEVISMMGNLLKQDEVDRTNIGLYGMKEKKIPMEGHEDSKPPKGVSKQIRPELLPITLDRNCLNCSSDIRLTYDAFKIACLIYRPTNVNFGARSFRRVDLIDLMLGKVSEIGLKPIPPRSPLKKTVESLMSSRQENIGLRSIEREKKIQITEPPSSKTYQQKLQTPKAASTSFHLPDPRRSLARRKNITPGDLLNQSFSVEKKYYNL
eukprot:TRINITY_DN2143_c0_g1_i5.p1 TRINITY_DN2143_c0_g1~~TRINITY_DN2143_c0_g1_i5.p1  ORF type:complete len:349 (-),score=64.67 TRINITY_DN2143_c0_g1_i5:3-1049(-)